MSDRARVLRALLRQDLSTFTHKVFTTLEPGASYQHNWHIDHLCWQLSRVARGELRRLIINVPPRSMKSITASVAFPLWYLGSNPSKKIICVSYADELARKLAVDTRTVLESPWFRDLYPRLRLASKRPRTMDLPTTEHGSRYAAGMNGAVLGRGADLIVIDDPIKATDALSKAERRRVNDAFDNTIYTRLSSKREGAIIIIMQRLHQDDLVGHVLAKGDWEVVSIPAIETADREYRLSNEPEDVYFRRAGEVLHNDREGREELEIVRRTQGSLLFSAQYQQAPVPPEGNIVKRDWIRFYDAPPPSFDFTIASWDTASTISDTADYSVGTTWGAKGLDFYLLDVVRDRFEVPELRQRILELARRRSVDQTVIEDAVSVSLDITDRERAEEQRHELNHRVKNTLATVQAIAVQTLRGAASTTDASEALTDRLMALAKAHDALTRESWEGAELHEIVEAATDPYGGRNRVAVNGPSVWLSPALSLSLALSLHELATNAAKYGALSTAAGSIAITWEVVDRRSDARLKLRWTERGGPPVRPPTRRGFGSRLIERSLAAENGGSATIE